MFIFCVCLQEFGKLALKCLCEMLVNHPHFNYRNVIISAVVPFTNHKNSEVRKIVRGKKVIVYKSYLYTLTQIVIQLNTTYSGE